ncbi:MAG: primosomal protein N' [Caldibacillus debilis]|uniref:primosomal protein N' n=1 Tax=Caldibacillus debilis TaxID=301148 RepID=UPI000E3AB053|nr:primosomal protein N' [Caldibacillus debilis]MBO2480482.1 primosomal protein N' [Bacillaceae bacterium]REJ13631.1 MAG: primosomal protein N' [Caldibacillus debilis]
MTVASVVVDVKNLSVDHPFDYLVPPEWEGLIEPGMRVIVPFGSRKVQGFVVSLKEKAEREQLKAIIEPMDEQPVLTEELLELGEWLSENTLCLKIAAFQAMLPAALKVNYEKYLVPAGGNPGEGPGYFRELFQNRDKIGWDEALRLVEKGALYRGIREGLLRVEYRIKSKGTVRKETYYVPAVPKESFSEKRASLPKTARKQLEIADFYLEHFHAHSAAELRERFPQFSGPVNALIRKGMLKKEEREQYRDPYEHQAVEPSRPHPLTPEQEEAIRPVRRAIESGEPDVFLLYGVTGSGKTEVYMHAIRQVLEKGKEAIVLVPEIALTPQMVARFKSRFGDKVAVLHSGLSAGEKYDEWRKIQRKEVQVAVGARSAVFAPFENLGIIIIDEEHETTYKQEETPRYHARDVAIRRAQSHRCPVILGSATPSLESFARAKKGVYKLLKLEKRMNNMPLPSVEIVDMRKEMHAGNRLVFSRLLMEKMKDRLERGEQTVLLLNRRGYATFLLCRGCGYTMVCPNCEVTLTYHKVSDTVKCHYCGYEGSAPKRCPACGGEHIRYFGTGTQKVEEELKKLFPEARVIRMDVDTTRRKGSHEKLLKDFYEGKGDILLGTQMIAKGLDFPNITLVGVLSADIGLNMPDFRAGERTFQLLTQVSGRAGRHRLPGEVVIQTYAPDHYSVKLARDYRFLDFYRHEMNMRKRGNYPPYYYLVLIVVTHENAMTAAKIIHQIASFLRGRLDERTIVLGPGASPISRLNNKYRYQLLIKYKRDPNLFPALKQISRLFIKEQTKDGVGIHIDVNPYSLL